MTLRGLRSSSFDGQVDQNRIHVFPCGDSPEEADLRLGNLCNHIATVKRGLKYFFLTSDKGFRLTAGSIEAFDPTAITEVLAKQQEGSNNINEMLKVFDKFTRPKRKAPTKNNFNLKKRKH
eukprot:TRINITY_DN7663_c0_g1_i1.p1 TRINITY_DN7663_c0_g1~~TRINITY_DN7663_c0_g1_i1.p1  ORF type:complete len:121 (-),score=25.41 TRINITY_DN7663_c0_g1_i1:195-557(-)